MKLFHRRQHKDEELDAEIRHHLDEAIRDRIERGQSPEQARANALREFGNVGLVKKVTREMWGRASVERLLQGLRYGARMLKKNPVFTFVAALKLALGLGAALTVTRWAESLLFGLKPNDPLTIGVGGAGAAGGRGGRGVFTCAQSRAG